MKFLAIVFIIRVAIMLMNNKSKSEIKEENIRNEVRDPAAFRLRY